MKDFVYVLREDMYHEWAWENGSTNLIAVSDDIETIICELRTYINLELGEDDERIVQNKGTSVDEIIKSANDDLMNGKNVYIDIYTNEENYNNGYNNGTFVIEIMVVK